MFSKGIEDVRQVHFLMLVQPMYPNQSVFMIFGMNDGKIILSFNIATFHYYYQKGESKMMLINKYVLLLFLTVSISTLDYDSNHTLQCSSINDTWTFDQNLEYLWNIVELHAIDRFAFIIVCPLLTVCHAILILTYARYRLFRHSPEDVIFALIITEAFLNLSLFSNAIYDTVHSNHDPMPSSFPQFCFVFGLFNTFFSITEVIYLIYFLIHVILNVNKSIKENKWFTGKCRHILPVILSFIVVLVITELGWMGLSQLGICEMASTRVKNAQIYFPIIKLSFSLAFIIFSIYTYNYFRDHMPQSSALNKRKFQQNMLISRFTVGMSIIQCLYALAIFLLYINCQSSNPKSFMLIFATVFNLTRIIQFIYLIIVLVLYQKIGNKIKKLFRSMFARDDHDEKSELDSRRVTRRQIFQLLDVGLKEKMFDILEEQNKIDFLRVTQVITMLVGVRIAFREYLSPDVGTKPLKKLYYREEISFKIDSKWLRELEKEASILPRLSLLDGNFTIYSPQIFQRFLIQDGTDDISESFDLIKNSEQIYQIGEDRGGEGGRSGQFFFFSSDNKYILKTVNKDEFLLLLEDLPLFYQHFTTYPDTLICKIYGMFKIVHEQISRIYYVLLMKNISGCDKTQILRTYDMKGSTDDRRVLKDETELPLSASTVYKDLDFMQLEHKLYIRSQLIRQFQEQLKIDTTFLKDLNIIDYSLLVMKVDWGRAPENARFWGKLQRILSAKYKQVYYHVSLIDVSQKWDLQKRGQNWWKKLLGKKDTSAQQPSFYQARFMKFIRQITTYDLDNDWHSQRKKSIFNHRIILSEKREPELEVQLQHYQQQIDQRSKTEDIDAAVRNFKTFSSK